MDNEEIRNLFKDGKLVIGTDRVLKGVREGTITKVIAAKNCPEETLKELAHYKKLTTIDIEHSDLTNEQLGVLCKKRFSIALIGVLA
ncbi:50S ribosomal protein L30 [Candidatus Woesearchaeota archaeon]|nr:50S ribosomal protein L30 [Candidatus Woesearchaeota archaeon]